MSKFLIELMQVMIFVFFCFCESTSLNIKGNHRIIPCSIGRDVYKNSPFTPLNSLGRFRLRALSLGFENDCEEDQEISEKCAAWSSILNPSSPVMPVEDTCMNALDKLRITIFVGCVINALLMMFFKLAPGCWRFFLAGGLCAAISHTIPTPVDVVKVSEMCKTVSRTKP